MSMTFENSFRLFPWNIYGLFSKGKMSVLYDLCVEHSVIERSVCHVAVARVQHVTNICIATKVSTKPCFLFALVRASLQESVNNSTAVKHRSPSLSFRNILYFWLVAILEITTKIKKMVKGNQLVSDQCLDDGWPASAVPVQCK